MKRLNLPLKKEEIEGLKAGDAVLLSGKIYTARDAAHKRLCEAIAAGEGLPLELKGACIYYAGPCPTPPGFAVGSCGPTTSKRMDAYAPTLYERGVQCVIGKGQVAPEVKKSIVRNGRVYFCATGGAGALIAQSVKRCKVVAYEELLAEAIHEFWVEDFPAVVAIDAAGADIFEIGPAQYRKEEK